MDAGATFLVDGIPRDDCGEDRCQAQGVVAASDGVMPCDQARLLEKPGPSLVGGFKQKVRFIEQVEIRRRGCGFCGETSQAEQPAMHRREDCDLLKAIGRGFPGEHDRLGLKQLARHGLVVVPPRWQTSGLARRRLRRC